MKPDNRLFLIGALFIIFTLASGCTTRNPQPELSSSVPTVTKAVETMVKPTEIEGGLADVLSVNVSGNVNEYQFTVEISSPDLGCEQYADWWEVFDDQGNLLYRRILAHSHVNEQPFKRSGGLVAVDADTVVWVRAHMHPFGYGGEVQKGSVNSGFQTSELPQGFAERLEELPPLPDNCAF